MYIYPNLSIDLSDLLLLALAVASRDMNIRYLKALIIGPYVSS